MRAFREIVATAVRKSRKAPRRRHR
jgi:hypothetical protein